MSNSSDKNNSSTERAIITRPRIRCGTTVERIKYEYIWTISDYMSAFIDRGKSEVESSWFSATKNTCMFQIRLDLSYNNLLEVYIVPKNWQLVKENGLFEIETKFALINSEGQTSQRILTKRILLGGCYSYKVGTLIGKYELIQNKDKLLPQDKLTVSCEFIFAIQEENVDYEYPKPSRVSLLDAKDLSLDGFERLFNNQEFSDVTIHVNGKQFPAHKSILAGRSEVFAAMLKHKMKENLTSRIDIKDIDDKVFLQALRFIYTGKVENIEESAVQLLPVADKYFLVKLKAMCEEALYKKLSQETVINILILADVYNLEALKSHAVQYVKKYSIDVLKNVDSKSWASLLSRPHLSKYVFLKCLK